jgi:hypothetical protein
MASFLAMCPRVDSPIPVIISYLETAEVIINPISMFCIGSCFAKDIISEFTNCSPNLIAKYLAVSDNFFEPFFCQSRFELLILGDFLNVFVRISA